MSAEPTPPSRFSIASGFEPAEVSGSRGTGSVELGPDHHTPWGMVRGGVCCSIVRSQVRLQNFALPDA